MLRQIELTTFVGSTKIAYATKEQNWDSGGHVQ